MSCQLSKDKFDTDICQRKQVLYEAANFPVEQPVNLSKIEKWTTKFYCYLNHKNDINIKLHNTYIY